MEQARAEVEQAKAELEKAEKFMERSKHLFERKVVSAQDWDTNRTSYEVAMARYKAAQERYALVKEGPRKEEIDQARAEVERSRASLSLANSRRLQVKVLRQDLETQKALIKEARASLEVAIRQLEYSEVFAPVPGVVLVKSAEEGEYVSAGATVVTIADLDHPWLKAYLDETDLGRVKLGPGGPYPDEIPFPIKLTRGRSLSSLRKPNSHPSRSRRRRNGSNSSTGSKWMSITRKAS